MTPTPFCEKQLELINLWADALSFQVRAALALSYATESVSRDQREILRKDLQVIRTYADAALEACREHVIEHGCGFLPRRF